MALLPNVPLYSKLYHDVLRPWRFNQALSRFGAALHAALKRHQSAVGVNLPKKKIRNFVTYNVIMYFRGQTLDSYMYMLKTTRLLKSIKEQRLLWKILSRICNSFLFHAFYFRVASKAPMRFTVQKKAAQLFHTFFNYNFLRINNLSKHFKQKLLSLLSSSD